MNLITNIVLAAATVTATVTEPPIRDPARPEERSGKTSSTGWPRSPTHGPRSGAPPRSGPL